LLFFVHKLGAAIKWSGGVFGPTFVEVIHVYADLNDRTRGMAGCRTAFGCRRSTWRTTLGLVNFARKTFGGRLRRIADDVDGASSWRPTLNPSVPTKPRCFRHGTTTFNLLPVGRTGPQFAQTAGVLDRHGTEQRFTTLRPTI
jgi:hypothetical protein